MDAKLHGKVLRLDASVVGRDQTFRVLCGEADLSLSASRRARKGRTRSATVRKRYERLTGV